MLRGPVGWLRNSWAAIFYVGKWEIAQMLLATRLEDITLKERHVIMSHFADSLWLLDLRSLYLIFMVIIIFFWWEDSKYTHVIITPKEQRKVELIEWVVSIKNEHYQYKQFQARLKKNV